MATKFTFLVPPSRVKKAAVTYSSLKSATVNHAGSPLKKSYSISAVSIAAAALEVGYGPKSKWQKNRAMSFIEKRELASFLTSRAKTILRMFESQNGQLVVRDFNRLLDASDKTSMHYALGQIGASFAIRHWLGHKPRRIIHAGLLAKSMIRGTPPSDKLPDFLVEDSKGKWHALEAKCGQSSYKKSAIDEALLQLNAINGFYLGASKQTIDCRVCSFVEIPEPGHPIEFTVVDPPGDEQAADEDMPRLLVDLAEAAQYLEVSDSLRSLNPVRLNQFGDHPYAATWRSVGFSSLQVLVPHVSQELKDLRWRVKLMFSVLDHRDLIASIFRPAPRPPNGSIPVPRSARERIFLADAELPMKGPAAKFLQEFEILSGNVPEDAVYRDHVLTEMERRLQFPKALEALKLEVGRLRGQVDGRVFETDHGLYRPHPEEAKGLPENEVD